MKMQRRLIHCTETNFVRRAIFNTGNSISVAIWHVDDVLSHAGHNRFYNKSFHLKLCNYINYIMTRAIVLRQTLCINYITVRARVVNDTLNK